MSDELFDAAKKVVERQKAAESCLSKIADAVDSGYFGDRVTSTVKEEMTKTALDLLSKGWERNEVSPFDRWIGVQ